MSRTAIEPAVKDWAYGQITANYRAGRNVWVEVSPEFAQQALEVLPPIYQQGGFLVSEASCHNAEGHAVYAGFAQIGGRHFSRELTVKDFEPAVQQLRDTLLCR